MSAVLEIVDDGLRVMRHADIPAVLEIEASAYAYPWSRGIFRDCLRVGYSCWVLEEHGEIQGYALMSLVPEESHILNLCIKPALQGQGLGRRVLQGMLTIARQSKVTTIMLEVRPSNRAALALYRSEGFNEVGTRPRYYPAERGREDGVILAKQL